MNNKKEHAKSGAGNGGDKAIPKTHLWGGISETGTPSTPNDPLVLYVEAIEFEPNIHINRRKLTVDIEIPAINIEELITKLSQRVKEPTPGGVRIRFIGRPV